MTATNATPATVDQRKAQLAQAIQNEVVKGGRVETQGDFNAIVRYDKSVNHVLHLILTLVTVTLWMWVWLIVAIVAAVGRKTVSITVDEFGNVVRQEV